MGTSYHPSSHNHGSVKIGLPPIVPLFKYSQTFDHDGRFSIVFPVIFVKTLYLYLSHRQGQTLRCHTSPLSSWHLCRYLPEANVEKQTWDVQNPHVKSARIYLFHWCRISSTVSFDLDMIGSFSLSCYMFWTIFDSFKTFAVMLQCTQRLQGIVQVATQRWEFG